MNSIIINRIPYLFNDHSEASVLSIRKQNDRTYALSIGEVAETETTLSHFNEIIGESRLRQISLIPELGIAPSEIDQNTLILTKNVVRRIFAGIAHIRIDDLKDARYAKQAADAFQSIKMCVIRNGGDDSKKELDYIPYIGGVHIGEGSDKAQCEIDLYYIHKESAK